MNRRLICIIVVTSLGLNAMADEGSPSLGSWAQRALLDDSADLGRPSVELRLQDHGQLQIRKSVLGTPLQIGTQKFQNGIGSHATSEIVVHADRTIKRFEAKV